MDYINSDPSKLTAFKDKTPSGDVLYIHDPESIFFMYIELSSLANVIKYPVDELLKIISPESRTVLDYKYLSKIKGYDTYIKGTNNSKELIITDFSTLIEFIYNLTSSQAKRYGVELALGSVDRVIREEIKHYEVPKDFINSNPANLYTVLESSPVGDLVYICDDHHNKKYFTIENIAKVFEYDVSDSICWELKLDETEFAFIKTSYLTKIKNFDTITENINPYGTTLINAACFNKIVKHELERFTEEIHNPEVSEKFIKRNEHIFNLLKMYKTAPDYQLYELQHHDFTGTYMN